MLTDTLYYVLPECRKYASSARHCLADTEVHKVYNVNGKRMKRILMKNHKRTILSRR